MNMFMKKTVFATLLLLVAAKIVAQPLPQDRTIRTGKLKNGLTYYLRHNAKEPGLADFYIAQKVGSIQEEPRQRGLAHFLEHMAFNGTKHFPGKGKQLGIVPWCESIGVKFGANLNAYTSVEQTVYNISSVPLKREGIADSCLLILNDWSHYLLLEDKEIDKERGVIHEEWRTRRAGRAVSRLMEQAMPKIYKGTKYEDCMPIGSMDIVDNFPYQDLRDYYHKWYRPDLQAIIVVGDIDVDKMEKKIKKLFSKIPAPKNPAKREEVYQIGKLGKAHGIKGEVSFLFDDDVFDRVDADYLILDIDGILVPFFIEEYRFKNDANALMKFEGIDTLERARELTGCDVYFPRELSEADEDSLSWAAIKGFELIDADTNASVGRIAAIDDSTINILFELEDGKLIPASEELITHIDTKKQQIVIHLPEGILEL